MMDEHVFHKPTNEDESIEERPIQTLDVQVETANRAKGSLNFTGLLFCELGIPQKGHLNDVIWHIFKIPHIVIL